MNDILLGVVINYSPDFQSVYFRISGIHYIKARPPLNLFSVNIRSEKWDYSTNNLHVMKNFP